MRSVRPKSLLLRGCGVEGMELVRASSAVTAVTSFVVLFTPCATTASASKPHHTNALNVSVTMSADDAEPRAPAMSGFAGDSPTFSTAALMTRRAAATLSRVPISGLTRSGCCAAATTMPSASVNVDATLPVPVDTAAVAPAPAPAPPAPLVGGVSGVRCNLPACSCDTTAHRATERQDTLASSCR